MPRALITGITGQDGSYLAELLLDKGYEVCGVVRRSSTESYERIDHLRDRLHLRAGRPPRPAVADGGARAGRARRGLQPGGAVLRADLVDPAGADRRVHRRRRHPPAGGDPPVDPTIRFYQASSSEMFGNVLETPAERDHAVLPAQPLRRRQGLRALHHRELPRVVRHVRLLRDPLQPRVARGAGWSSSRARSPTASRASSSGLADHLTLGNLDARRDWGFAGDYVDAMWRMLQQDEPDDYVVATGVTNTVGRLVELAFEHAGLDRDEHVRTDPALIRPAEVDLLVGDPAKAREQLGWEPAVELRGPRPDDGRRRPGAAQAVGVGEAAPRRHDPERLTGPAPVSCWKTLNSSHRSSQW